MNPSYFSTDKIFNNLYIEKLSHSLIRSQPIDVMELILI